MKRLLMAILCGFVLFGVVGCTTEENKSESQGKKTNYGMNEPVVVKDVEYTVTNVEYSNGDEWNVPADGKNYVVVTVQINNNSDSKVSYNMLDWKMVNSSGQEDSETFTTLYQDSQLNSGDLAPGGTKTGTLIYEEPVDDSLKLLYYSTMIDEEPQFEIVIK